MLSKTWGGVFSAAVTSPNDLVCHRDQKPWKRVPRSESPGMDRPHTSRVWDGEMNQLVSDRKL